MARNVLFITVDQYRADCLSYLGHRVVETPAIDGLCREGVCFSNHWSVTAPCGPARASLYTGTYLHHHRSVLNGTPLDARLTNVALEARNAGYDPVLFGYTDTSVDPRTVEASDPRLRTYEGILPGFRPIVHDPFEAGGLEWGRWLASRGYDVPSNPRELYRGDSSHPGACEHAESWAPALFGPEDTETAFVTERVIDWLGAHGAEPFFLHASYIRPHPPYRNPVGYHDLYSADDLPPFVGHNTRGEEQAMHPFVSALLTLPPIASPADERDRRQQRATYHGMQAEVDHQLGRLFSYLGDTGLARDTLVVLTSDHGEMGGDHWAFEKGGHWDESYRVPLVIVDPTRAADASRGSVVEAFTESVDVAPTILEWMGCEVPAQVDGRPLTEWLESSAGAVPNGWRSEAHVEWDFRNPASQLAESLLGIPSAHCSLTFLRSDTSKYVQFSAGRDVLPPLLFDLTSDPDQLVDVSGSPEHLEDRLGAVERLLDWRMRFDDDTLANHLLTTSGLVEHRDRWR